MSFAVGCKRERQSETKRKSSATTTPSYLPRLPTYKQLSTNNNITNRPWCFEGFHLCSGGLPSLPRSKVVELRLRVVWLVVGGVVCSVYWVSGILTYFFVVGMAAFDFAKYGSVHVKLCVCWVVFVCSVLVVGCLQGASCRRERSRLLSTTWTSRRLASQPGKKPKGTPQRNTSMKIPHSTRISNLMNSIQHLNHHHHHHHHQITSIFDCRGWVGLGFGL